MNVLVLLVLELAECQILGLTGNDCLIVLNVVAHIVAPNVAVSLVEYQSGIALEVVTVVTIVQAQHIEVGLLVHIVHKDVASTPLDNVCGIGQLRLNVQLERTTGVVENGQLLGEVAGSSLNLQYLLVGLVVTLLVSLAQQTCYVDHVLGVGRQLLQGELVSTISALNHLTVSEYCVSSGSLRGSLLSLNCGVSKCLDLHGLNLYRQGLSGGSRLNQCSGHRCGNDSGRECQLAYNGVVVSTCLTCYVDYVVTLGSQVCSGECVLTVGVLQRLNGAVCENSISSRLRCACLSYGVSVLGNAIGHHLNGCTCQAGRSNLCTHCNILHRVLSLATRQSHTSEHSADKSNFK